MPSDAGDGVRVGDVAAAEGTIASTPETAAAIVAPAPPSLAARLNALRPRRSTSARSEHADTAEALARLAGGQFVAPGLLLVERRHALPWLHGRIRIGVQASDGVDVPVRRRETLQVRAAHLALLDTETTGLAGGTGTFVFLVGVARFEGALLVVRQWVVTRFAAETALLAAVRAVLADIHCLVTYNGKSFDVPLLKTRFTLAREPHPFDALVHADLLHATRRRLQDGWPDCRLRTAEERALAFARRDDLPGAQVPLAWERWLRHGDPTPVPRILDHNREDLLSLAALLELHRWPTAREAPLLHLARISGGGSR